MNLWRPASPISKLSISEYFARGFFSTHSPWSSGIGRQRGKVDLRAIAMDELVVTTTLIAILRKS